jgi:hypothetical protein
MKNKPNMYRVTYLVAEGNHYAGGWGERVKDVSTLEDATKFNKIQSVNEIFIEIGDEIGEEELNKALDRRVDSENEKAKKAEISRLEKRLAEARAGL